MKYGYCSEIKDYSWSLTHGNVTIGDKDEMYANITLIRTLSEKFYGTESSYHEAVNRILCFDDFFVRSFSISVKAKEIYYWKPKEARVSPGQVINYNEPCDEWDEPRELRGCTATFTCSGIGDPSCETQTEIVSAADAIIYAMEGVKGFEIKGDSHQFALNSWESSSLQGSFTTADNMRNEELSSHSMSVSGLQGVNDHFVIAESKVQLFPDRYPTMVGFKSVRSGLKNQAGVGCK